MQTSIHKRLSRRAAYLFLPLLPITLASYSRLPSIGINGGSSWVIITLLRGELWIQTVPLVKFVRQPPTWSQIDGYETYKARQDEIRDGLLRATWPRFRLWILIASLATVLAGWRGLILVITYRRRCQGKCENCGYLVQHTLSVCCPECGTPVIQVTSARPADQESGRPSG